MTQCSYLFLDESGNFDFGPKGTPYFVLTGISIKRPFRWLQGLDDLKYDCLESGLIDECFHCSEDTRGLRDKVFGLLSGHLDDVYIDSVIAEKVQISDTLREDELFYTEMFKHLLWIASRRLLLLGCAATTANPRIDVVG